MSQYGHFVVSMPPVRSMASVLRRERSHALAGQMRLDPGGYCCYTRKPGAERIGPESGPLSIWLCHSLTALGLPPGASMPAMPRRRCCCSSTRATPTTPAAWLRSPPGWYREVADKSLGWAAGTGHDHGAGPAGCLVGRSRHQILFSQAVWPAGRQGGGQDLHRKGPPLIPDGPLHDVVEALLRGLGSHQQGGRHTEPASGHRSPSGRDGASADDRARCRCAGGADLCQHDR